MNIVLGEGVVGNNLTVILPRKSREEKKTRDYSLYWKANIIIYNK